MIRFYNNTDANDIESKVLGISNNLSLDDRGLKITIRHNGSKELFNKASELQAIIVKALNEYELKQSELALARTKPKKELWEIAVTKGLVGNTEKMSDYTVGALRALVGE